VRHNSPCYPNNDRSQISQIARFIDITMSLSVPRRAFPGSSRQWLPGFSLAADPAYDQSVHCGIPELPPARHCWHAPCTGSHLWRAWSLHGESRPARPRLAITSPCWQTGVPGCTPTLVWTLSKPISRPTALC